MKKLAKLIIFVLLLLQQTIASEGQDDCECEPVIFNREQSNGIILSPNYPKLYCPNLNCSWTIEAGDPWTAVRLRFRDFETDRGDGLVVWQTENDNLIFMDWFSGKGTRPDLITALGNGLQIAFRSRGSSHGFELIFERFTGVSWSRMQEEELKNKCQMEQEYKTTFLHGSCFAVGPKGTYTAPPSDDVYRGVTFEEAFRSCNLYPNGHLAFLNNEQLSKEISYALWDFLWEGFAKWIGLNQTTKYIVERHEDPRAGWEWVLPNGQSWEAEYKETRWDKQDEVGSEPDNWGGQDCGVVDGHTSPYLLYDFWCKKQFQYFCEYESLYPCPKMLYDADEPGSIQSPTFTKDIRCYYVIKTDHFHSIKLKLGKIKIGPADSIRVYDGNRGTGYSNLLMVWARDSTDNAKEVVGRSNELTVVFNSANKGSSFRAQYSKVRSTCKCQNETILLGKSIQQGTITSPGFPRDYCSNLDCTWDFETASSDMIVQFRIDRLDTKQNGDWLLIRDTVEDGREYYKTTMTIFKRLIGSAKLEKTEIEKLQLTNSFKPLIFTAQQKAQLFFHSDGTVNGQGFQINYRAIRRHMACQCAQPQPKEYNRMESSFEFWHPEEDCHSIDCLYLIPFPSVEESRKKYLRLVIKVVADSRQPNGYLLVSEGMPYDLKNRREMHQRFAKATIDVEYRQTLLLLNQPFLKANGLTVHYHSQAEGIPPVGRNGFKLEYHWTATCFCGVTKLQAQYEQRLLVSPNFPDPYCPETNCTWTIKAPENHIIHVDILSLDIGDDDVLQIFDGVRPWATLLAKFPNFPMVELRSSKQMLQIVFLANNPNPKRGFELKYFSRALPDETPAPTVQQKRKVLICFLIVACFVHILVTSAIVAIVMQDIKKRNCSVSPEHEDMQIEIEIPAGPSRMPQEDIYKQLNGKQSETSEVALESHERPEVDSTPYEITEKSKYEQAIMDQNDSSQ